MPRIFDNIDHALLPALRDTLAASTRADFCVGYFNLRGWKAIDDLVESLPGENGRTVRLLVGMHQNPGDELRQAMRAPADELSNSVARDLRDKLAREFRDQLTIGTPTNEDEAGLRRLAAQLRGGKVHVKLFLRHPLHAKLYLCFRDDANNPRTAFVGSSNLTMAGLQRQGELNVDVLDHQATETLATWFEDRWRDRWCIDITKQLVEAIDESWARQTTPTPYEIYVKMAYHLSEEARAGLSQFDIPVEMRDRILPFQAAAVRIAARHLDRRGGVLLGDVVGLGKTLMATTLARILRDHPWNYNTLILCGKNLVKMWQGYVDTYNLAARVISITTVERDLPTLARFSLVIIDESHNLRNAEGKRYQVIRDYIVRNNSRCMLLSATPYNTAFKDLGSQLRLWLDPEDTLPMRPEEYIRNACSGSIEQFLARHQCAPDTLAAFEKSDSPDDWRELMRLFMVRRTRSFIEQHYGEVECPSCHAVVGPLDTTCSKCQRFKEASDRRFLALGDNKRFFFPKRIPKTVVVPADTGSLKDQYAHLYSEAVVELIGGLTLPRYGLALYLIGTPTPHPTPEEEAIIRNLGRAGKRLIGFCRTNLFKRLESSGSSFLLSVRRHIVRNYVFIHALEHGKPVPIGGQDISLFNTTSNDNDDDPTFEFDEEIVQQPTDQTASSLEEFKTVGRAAYDALARYGGRVQWLRPHLFTADLRTALEADCKALYGVLQSVMEWIPKNDQKLNELHQLLTRTHKNEKILVFTQFADTAEYLRQQLETRKLSQFGVVVGGKSGTEDLVKRFSPVSNGKRAEVPTENELRVLIATDVLSEGQNLQDAAIVVNYDLPWAIIRLIQRAGRVDRIGQEAEEIKAYSFVPAEGVEKLITLRERIRHRLHENAEVVGADERFFEDETPASARVRDLFTEKAGVLDDDPTDDEVDMESFAYQIWKDAIDRDESLKQTIPAFPALVYSTKHLDDVRFGLAPTQETSARTFRLRPKPGVIAFTRNAEGADALAWLDVHGNTITESQHAILRAAACAPETVTRERMVGHHELVTSAVASIDLAQQKQGGQLGRKSSPRRRAYERLTQYKQQVRGSLFDLPDLDAAVGALYARSLTNASRERIDALLRTGIDDAKLAEFVVSLHNDNRLCIEAVEGQRSEPVIICSLGIRGD